MVLKKIYQMNIFTLNFKWSLTPYHCQRSLEIRKGSLLPNTKCSQILDMVDRITKHCQMLQVWRISPKILNRSFFGQLTWNSSLTVRYMLLAMMPRNMILVAKENGVGGGANENCWILFYRCIRLKKWFWCVSPPGRKIGKTGCCQISKISG